MDYEKTFIEKVQTVFSQYIGKTIQTYRNQQKWTQEDLAKRMGMSYAAVSRYEAGTGNITAKQMAAISLILDFPMRRYIEAGANKPGDEPTPVDAAVREMIREYETAQEEKARAAVDDDVAFGYSRSGSTNSFPQQQETQNPKREAYEAKIKNKREKRDDFLEKNADKNIEVIREQFIEYFEDEPEKLDLLYDTYNIVLKWRESNKRYDELPTALISAVLNYITTDDDKETEKMLKLYKKWLECTISKEMDD